MKRPVTVSVLLSLFLALAAFAQEVKLELKRAEGPVRAVSTFKTQQTLTIAGMPFESTADVVVTTLSATGKPAADGTVRVDEKTEAMTMKLSLPGGLALNFDSSKPDEAKSDVPQLQSIIDGVKASVGAPYTYVIGKDNRVTKIEGTEAILGKLSPAAAEQAKEQFDPEVLKQQ